MLHLSREFFNRLLKSDDTSQINSTLKVLFVANGIFFFAASILGPLYALYAEQLASEPFLISLSVATSLFASALTTIFLSKFEFAAGKKYMLMFTYLIRSLLWVSLIYINQYFHLILIQMAFGVVDAIGNNMFSTIFAEHLDENKYSKDYAYWNLIASPGAAIAILVGGVLYETIGFGGIFLIMSALGLLAFNIIAFKLQTFCIETVET